MILDLEQGRARWSRKRQGAKTRLLFFLRNSICKGLLHFIRSIWAAAFSDFLSARWGLYCSCSWSLWCACELGGRAGILLARAASAVGLQPSLFCIQWGMGDRKDIPALVSLFWQIWPTVAECAQRVVSRLVAASGWFINLESLGVIVPSWRTLPLGAVSVEHAGLLRAQTCGNRRNEKSLSTFIYRYIVFCLAGAWMHVLMSREATTCASEWSKAARTREAHCYSLSWTKKKKNPKHNTLHVWVSSHLDWEFSQYQEESRL